MRAKRGQAKIEVKRLCAIVQKECELWPLAKNKKGYGILRWLGQSRIASRVICEIVHGHLPNGMEVAHSCGVSACCNPAHLRHATSVENKKDMKIHGTAQQGERHGGSKLNEKQAKEIKRSCLARKEIADKYKVSIETVYSIKNGINWSHI
jgi:hypothetical protein